MKKLHFALLSRFHSVVLLVGLVTGLWVAPAARGEDKPTLVNVDSALRKLSAHAQQTMPEAKTPGAHAQVAAVSKLDQKTTAGRFDASNRVLVHVHLDGHSTLAQVSRQIASLKGTVLDANASYRHGILAAYLPADQIANAAKITGVRALTLEHRPELRVGKVTSQGTAILGTNLLNKSGLNGDGITVGVLSDSFNTSYQAGPVATTAPQDVASGDLPVVNVLQDYPDGTDEGRAMCQIVYDEAPHCHIAFATGDYSEVGFANNIVALRTQAHCDVIVDDIGYFDEPVFSDGLLADAVDTVADSKTLPGKPAVYVSAAGNDGNNGYRGSYLNLSDAVVRQAGHHGNLKLVTDPNSPNYLDPSLTAGGWYNWNPNGGSEPVTPLEAPGPPNSQDAFLLILQWDDPTDQDHGITTNYNLLVFDQYGNYQPDLSGTTDAFGVQAPAQYASLFLGTNYQIAITRSTQKDRLAGPIPATHQLALYTSLDGESILTGKYFNPTPVASVPNVYGHPAADGAIAVAAYAYNWRATKPFSPEFENYSSAGPAAIYFDANSNRLASPDYRAKPEVAGIDGVRTTFFGNPYYNEPFAFFGTSAAAPSIAGVAALVLQGTGGPGSISPAVVKAALETGNQARPDITQPSTVLAANANGYVSVEAAGQSYFGNNYLTVSYLGTSGANLTSLTIDGSATGLTFDTKTFFLGALNGISASDIRMVGPSSGTSKFTLEFNKGTFTSGVSFGFTVGQDFAGVYPGYTQDTSGVGLEAEDLCFGSTATALFNDKKSLTGSFQNPAYTDFYSPADGYGLVDASAALAAAQYLKKTSP
jgi:hypothetical protein